MIIIIYTSSQYCTSILKYEMSKCAREKSAVTFEEYTVLYCSNALGTREFKFKSRGAGYKLLHSTRVRGKSQMFTGKTYPYVISFAVFITNIMINVQKTYVYLYFVYETAERRFPQSFRNSRVYKIYYMLRHTRARA